jgi:hypothetical protein
MIGNGQSVAVTETHEEHARNNVMVYVRAAADTRRLQRRRAMQYLLAAKDDEEFFARASQFMEGTWRNNVVLGGSALLGLGFGLVVGKFLPLRVRSVPTAAGLGLLGGVIPGLALRETITVRNVFNLGGLLFSAGVVIGDRRP